MGEIKIDSEFQTLIPPLTDDEFKRLEKSILAEGVREPIITWNGTIIDGHNRYRVCEKHGINCPSVGREFESRDAAKIWICENQLGRRNLEPGQKAALGIERNEAEIREKARLRKFAGKKIDLRVHGPEGTVSEKGTTNEIIAKQVGVSEATVKRVLGVKRKDPELYEKVKSGEVTAREAYRKVTNEKQETRNPQDRDASRTLRENKPTFTLDLLLTELTWNAEKFIESWTQSIEVYESTGVKLRAAEKRRLEKASANLLVEVNKIKERASNA